MYNKLNISHILIGIILMILLFSCRTEDDLSIDPPAETNIAPNSTIANLMARVATNDGSADNIIDGASNLTVQLPVTVTVNNVELEIIDEEDYLDIEDIIDEDNNDTDSVVISYPASVILTDYSIVQVNSDAELEALTFNSDNDEDIECVDFQYPIVISVFDEDNDAIDTITIYNDNQLYNFIEDIEAYAAVTINFPFSVSFTDNTTQLINTIAELENAIVTADNTCDEDDDNDFDDDDDEDCETCSTNELEDAFAQCEEWRISKLRRNNNSLENNYIGYMFSFNADGTIVVVADTSIFDGTWEAVENGGDITLLVNVVGLPDFNDTWNVVNINLAPVEKKIELRLGVDRLRFGSDCIND